MRTSVVTQRHWIGPDIGVHIALIAGTNVQRDDGRHGGSLQ